MDHLPLVPLMDVVLFPGCTAPMTLQRERSMAAVRAAEQAQGLIVVLAQRSPLVLEPTMDDLYTVGILARLGPVKSSPGRVEAQLQALRRVRVTYLSSQGPYLECSYEELAPAADEGEEIEALQKTLLAEAEAFSGLNLLALAGIPLPERLYQLAIQLDLPLAQRQKLLQASTHRESLELMRAHLQHEARVRELQKKLVEEASADLDRSQREQLLRQELVHIQRELGEDDADLVPLRSKLEKTAMPPQAREEAERQLHQLERIPSASSEYHVARTYLEVLVDLPWVTRTTDALDLARARRILDEDHYGLASVKERILEYLAVMRLNPGAHAPILCFVGPPGTGKTSLGKSIARALTRKFERISLGGMHDEAELRGHRRTYVGAMAGRLIQAIRRSKVSNPLLMLDEIDKLRHSFEGDPAAALLEVLDPAQNHEFHDNYLDVPFDLSKVFFITTANTVESIPSPLLDRLEVIRLSGYTPEEKLQIARRHLLPRLVEECGLLAQAPVVPDRTLEFLITRYTRESGVRELERQLARLLRRLALALAEGGQAPGTIEPQQAAELLGHHECPPPDLRATLQRGVAAGLAWTEYGGQLFYVEASCLPTAEPLTLTGSLGDVMKESARTARSYLVSRPELAEAGRTPVHIHIPAGATPKDGPSAGLAIVCALLSAFSGQICRADTALTGEITLCGLVLPVGGIKEKLLAAHRSGLRRVILPRANQSSLCELPPPLAQELELLWVDHVEEALPLVFSPSQKKGHKHDSSRRNAHRRSHGRTRPARP